MKILVTLLFALLLPVTGQAQDLGFKEAAAKYAPGVPLFAEVLEAISWVESRHDVNALRRNERTREDGTVAVSHDHGHMQINDYYWKSKLDAVDPRLWDKMLSDPRTCTKIGAWILAQNVQRYGFGWDAIAAYNTGRAIDLADCKGDSERVERGRQYAEKVFSYLARKGYLEPQTDPLAWERQGKATAPSVAHAREVNPALPMKQTINIAEYRRSGSWRPVQ